MIDILNNYELIEELAGERHSRPFCLYFTECSYAFVNLLGINVDHIREDVGS